MLREDPDLGEAVPVEVREQAAEACIAPVLRIPRGQWSGEQTEVIRDGIGLMVLRGLLIRRVGIDGRFGAELLGEGDVLRPWQGEDAMSTFPHSTGWRVIDPVIVAVLDERVARRFAHFPELTGRLVGRALERSRNLAVSMAIHQHARVDVRLTMLFWHLADRWGRVRPDGVLIPLRLTHTILSDLVAARRPTVSGAISRLARVGLVAKAEDGWLLTGEPPRELLEVQDVRGQRPGENADGIA